MPVWMHDVVWTAPQGAFENSPEIYRAGRRRESTGSYRVAEDPPVSASELSSLHLRRTEATMIVVLWWTIPGANWARPDKLRRKWRVVVGQLAT